MPINIPEGLFLCFSVTDAEYKMAVKSLETFRKKREECFDVAYQVRWDKRMGKAKYAFLELI